MSIGLNVKADEFVPRSSSSISTYSSLSPDAASSISSYSSLDPDAKEFSPTNIKVDLLTLNVGPKGQGVSNMTIDSDFINGIHTNPDFIMFFQELSNAQSTSLMEQYPDNFTMREQTNNNYNGILISNTFEFIKKKNNKIRVEVPKAETEIIKNINEHPPRSTYWTMLRHKDTGIKFMVCSIHRSISDKDNGNILMWQFLSEFIEYGTNYPDKQMILAGDFNYDFKIIPDDDNSKRYYNLENNLGQLDSFWNSFDQYKINLDVSSHKNPRIHRTDFIFPHGSHISLDDDNESHFNICNDCPHNGIIKTITLHKSIIGAKQKSRFLSFLLD